MAQSDGNHNTLHGIIDTYLVNPFNNFIRGIEGLATGPDGEKPLQSIIGEKNKGAWYPYFLDIQGLGRPGRCAAFTNHELREGGYDVAGNAWSTYNLQPVYDGYADVLQKPADENDYYQLLGYNMAAADALKSNFRTSELNPSQTYVANMYVSGSPYMQQAYQEGTSGYGSHTGELVNRDGEWKIRHNHHGLIEETPLEDLLGSDHEIGVTRISIPTVRNNKKENGGSLKQELSDWQDLSMKERHAYIKAAVKNGLHTMPEIREAYRKFAMGGPAQSYEDWKARMIAYRPDLKEGWDSGEYDYRGFYDDNPDYAYSMLKQDSDAHFTDRYKTAFHPTFSNESYYSADNPNTKVSLVDRLRYNPQALVGGSWGGDEQTGWTYTLSPSQVAHNWDSRRTVDYLSSAEDNGVSLKYPDGSLYREDDGAPLQKILPAATVYPKSYVGNLFRKGGYSRNTEAAALKGKAKWVYDYLRKGGIPHVYAAGIVGNIAQESRFDPNATNGTHWGYTQNDKHIRKIIEDTYGDYSPQHQLDFLIDGYKGRKFGQGMAGRFSSYRSRPSDMSYKDAAMHWVRDYERAAGQNDDARTFFADYYGNLFGGDIMGTQKGESPIPLAQPANTHVQLPANPPLRLPAFNEEILQGVYEGSYKEPDLTAPVQAAEPVMEETASPVMENKELSTYENIQKVMALQDTLNTQAAEEASYKPVALGNIKASNTSPYAIRINGYGGDIHIKPSHKGRLTELKERTGKTEEELYDDGNPAHRKMVVFARNARKWKHGDGGNLYDTGGDTEGQQPVGTQYPVEMYPVEQVSEVPADTMPIVDTVTGRIAGYSPGFDLNEATVTPYSHVDTTYSGPTEKGLEIVSPEAIPLMGGRSVATGAFNGLGHLADKAAESSIGQGINALITNPYVDAAATAYSGADLFNKYQNGYRFGENLGEDLITATEAVPVVGYAPKVAKGVVEVASSVKPMYNTARAKKNFVSELDWSPESWFSYRSKGKYDMEDVKVLASHVPEYHKIEQESKTNGTWLKNADGSNWEGDPREWVMLQSKDAQWLSPEGFYSGVDNKTHTINPEYQGNQWGSDNINIARSYSWPASNILKLHYPAQARTVVFDAKGKNWNELPYFSQSKNVDTNQLVESFFNSKYGVNADVVKIENVLDSGSNYHNGYPLAIHEPASTDFIIRSGVSRKSVLGNNGNFDVADPNIYKVLIPPAFLVGSYPYFEQE